MDNIKTVKRTYTMVRVYRPGNDIPEITQIFDEDEWEAEEEFIAKCRASGLEFDIERLVPH